MITQQNIIDDLQNNLENYKKKYKLNQLGIFGSFARNEANEESDIDIIVEFDDDAIDIFHIKKAFKSELQNKFNRKVDICSKKWIKPLFRNFILNETIYVE